MNPLPRETHVRQFAFSLGVQRTPEAPSIDFIRNSASEKQSQRTTQSINSDKKSN